MTAADGNAYESEMQRISASVASLLPDFEKDLSEIITVVRVDEIGKEKEDSSRALLLALHEGELWQAEMNRRDAGSCGVTAVKQGPGGWTVFAASDSYDVDGAARVLSRRWTVQVAPDEVIGFVTEQRENTGPASAERFARTLAATHGWSVGDFEFAEPR